MFVNWFCTTPRSDAGMSRTWIVCDASNGFGTLTGTVMLPRRATLTTPKMLVLTLWTYTARTDDSPQN